MSHQLETEYRDARLALQFEDLPAAKLRINGLDRDSLASAENAVVLRLSSTVQTDYEWHEFIEGVIEYTQDRITARLLASGQEIDRMEVVRGERT